MIFVNYVTKKLRPKITKVDLNDLILPKFIPTIGTSGMSITIANASTMGSIMAVVAALEMNIETKAVVTFLAKGVN